MDESQEPFSLAPNRYIRAGEVLAIAPGEAAPYVPPEPVETPIRTVWNGEVMDRTAVSAPAEPAMDPGVEQYIDEKEMWLEWLDVFNDNRYHTPAAWEEYNRAQAIFAERRAYRERVGRMQLASWECRPMPPAPKMKE